MENTTKVCPYCGQQLGAEENFCTKCGQVYVEPQQAAYTTNNNQNAQYTTANNQAQQQVYATNDNQAQQQVYATNDNQAQQQVYATNNNQAQQQVYTTNNSYTTTVPPVAETPVAEPPAAKAPVTEKPKKKTGLIIGIIVAVLVIAAAVFAAIKFDLFGKVFDKNSADNNGGTTEVKTADGKTIKLDDNTYLLEMYPDMKCDENELKDMAKTIGERVKVLGDDYSISSDSDKITLTINQSLLGDTPEERAHNLKLIESNGNQAVMMSGIYTSCWPFSSDNIKELKIETVKRDDFVKEHKDKFSELNLAAFEEIDSDDIYVVKAKVDSELDETISDAGKYTTGEVPVIATDIVDDNVEEMLSDRKIVDIVSIKEDGYSEFYIVSPQAQSKKNAELVVALLNGKGFERALDTRLIAEPEWETDSLVMGANQAKSIDGDAVTFEYTPSAYTMSYMDKEEYDGYIKAIKTRLDSLQTPYALGYAGLEQKTIVVKISPEKMSADFGRFIFGGDSVELYTQFKTLSASVDEMSVVEDHNGKPAIKVTYYTDKAELYETYSLTKEDSFDVSLDDEESTEIVDDGSAKPVYLVINDVNVASADLSEMTDNNEIYFTNFLFAGDEEITTDDLDVLNMFVADIDSYFYLASDSDDDFEIIIRHYNGKTEITDDINWGYDARNDYDREVIKKVKELGHKMTFSPSKRNTAVVEVDVKIDGDLAKNFCAEVKKLYEECNFGDGSYAGVIFKVKDEQKKSIGDKCRLEFGKDAYDKVGLTFIDYVSGPTFSEYWSDFYDILEEDEFFVEKERY